MSFYMSNEKLKESEKLSLTPEEAASKYIWDAAPFSDGDGIRQTFIAGAAWQKEKDKALAMKLQGMQPWITDRELQAVFTETINQLINSNEHT